MKLFHSKIFLRTFFFNSLCVYKFFTIINEIITRELFLSLLIIVNHKIRFSVYNIFCLEALPFRYNIQ